MNGTLIQNWNITMPINVTESLVIANATSDLTLYTNSTSNDTSVQLFVNFCVNDQPAGLDLYAELVTAYLTGLNDLFSGSNSTMGGNSTTAAGGAATSAASSTAAESTTSGESTSMASDASSTASDASSTASGVTDTVASGASSVGSAGVSGASSVVSDAISGVTGAVGAATSAIAGAIPTRLVSDSTLQTPNAAVACADHTFYTVNMKQTAIEHSAE